MSDELIRAAQQRLQGRLIEPAPDELDEARAAAIAAARTAYVAVEAFRGFLTPLGSDWTDEQPGARERGAWKRYSTAFRIMLSELGAFGVDLQRATEPEPAPPERELAALSPALVEQPPYQRGQLVRVEGEAHALTVLDCRRHPAIPGWAIQVAGAGGSTVWMPAAKASAPRCTRCGDGIAGQVCGCTVVP